MFFCPFVLVGECRFRSRSYLQAQCLSKCVHFKPFSSGYDNKHVNGISVGYSGYMTNGNGGLQSYSNGMGHIHLHRSAWHHGTLLTLSQDIFTLSFPQGCPGKSWIQMCRLMLEARMVMHHENTMNNHNMTKIWCMTWCNERPQAEPNTGCIFLLNRDPGSSCSQVAPLLLFHRASAWQADSPGYSWGDDETTNGKVVCMADTRIQSLEKVKTSQNKELVRIWQSLQFPALSQILFSLQSVARLPFPEPCPSIWCTPGMVKKAETTKPTTSDLKSSKSGRLPHPPVRFQCSQVSAWLKPARICNEGWIS